MDSMYSWGEFFETLKGMKENGDDAKDELFEQMSYYFQQLDRACTREEIYNILIAVSALFLMQKNAQNRINSKCLDGLLLTQHALFSGELDLWRALAEDYPEYIDTCKFYISKGITKHSVYAACEFDRPEILILLMQNGIKSPAGARICSLFGSLQCLKIIYAEDQECLGLQEFRDAIRSGNVEMVKFFLDIGNASITAEAFSTAANAGFCEILELFFERDRNRSCNTAFALFEACKEHRHEAVKVLLKHGAQVTNFLLSFDDAFDEGIMKILREEKEQREKNTQV